MFQLEQPSTFEQIVKKSRFVAHAFPITTEDEAKAVLAVKGDVGANHNCWAWRVGSAYRFSDDGEPSGTAGKPILAAIDGQSLTNIVVIVTRWFGGILLGSGGLVRAYGGTAAACLKDAPMVELKPSVEGRVRIEFTDLARVKARLLAVPDLTIFEEHFIATGADLLLRVPEAEVEAVSRLICDLTSGRSELIFD